MSIDYKSAGVDIAQGNEAVDRIKKHVKRTFSKNVLSSIGGFGGLFDLSELSAQYQAPVLVQSIDGVGTKTIVARMAGCYEYLGWDLVSATVNDIVVLGAKPLTLLDYIANDRLNVDTVEQFVKGMSDACADAGIALIGGETAEMPDTYLPGEHDVVGVVTGVVDKENIIDGSSIQPGDHVLAFASSGLHTNGFSLARKLFFDVGQFSIDALLPELQKPLAEVLLTPHINYSNPVQQLLSRQVTIKGIAHITGGGLLENVPRVLPAHCSVEIDKSAWPEQPVFSVMQQLGDIAESEMYRTFNMGVGLVMIVAGDQVDALKANSSLPVFDIGTVVESKGSTSEVII